MVHWVVCRPVRTERKDIKWFSIGGHKKLEETKQQRGLSTNFALMFPQEDTHKITCFRNGNIEEVAGH